MKSIFKASQISFPYHYKFPGQASDERILYATRENKFLLQMRRALVIVAALSIFITGFGLKYIVNQIAGDGFGFMINVMVFIISALFVLIGWWWVTATWKKSIAVVTTKRLAKFIFTTPVSRHSLSLPLEMIVDTGAYSKGFIQSFLNLGTFTARSSASSSGVATEDVSRVNKKYFYIENIKQAEDLQHYVTKLLSVFRQPNVELSKFRPFLPGLKGEARANYIRENYPEYWS